MKPNFQMLDNNTEYFREYCIETGEIGRKNCDL